MYSLSTSTRLAYALGHKRPQRAPMGHTTPRCSPIVKARRGRGEGSVVERADGRWEGRVSLGRDASGRYERQSFYGKTKDDVLKQLAQHARAPKTTAGSATIAQLLERWLVEKVEPRRRATTFNQYDGIARKWIVPFVGDRRVDRFELDDLERLYARIERDGASARTRQLVHVVLNVAFKQAQRWKMMATNPCALVEPPQYRAAERKPLTVEQARALLAAARGHRLYGAIVLPLATGMRPGEVFGLQWGAVDLKARRLRVEYSLQEASNAPELVDPKTRTSRRELALPPIAIEALEIRQRAALAEGNRASPFVFTSVDGTPLRKSNFIRDVWRPLLRDAGLIEPPKSVTGRRAKRTAVPSEAALHYHDLRHSFATMQRAAGTSLQTVKEVLGHTSIRITSDIYTHRDEAAHDEAAERAERFLKAAKKN